MAKHWNSAIISVFWCSSSVGCNLISILLLMAGSSAAQPSWKNAEGEMERGDFSDLRCSVWTDVKNCRAEHDNTPLSMSGMLILPPPSLINHCCWYFNVDLLDSIKKESQKGNGKKKQELCDINQKDIVRSDWWLQSWESGCYLQWCAFRYISRWNRL